MHFFFINSLAKESIISTIRLDTRYDIQDYIHMYVYIHICVYIYMENIYICIDKSKA